MASSLDFNPNIREILPSEVLVRLKIVPLVLLEDKMCLVARRPLSDQALLELKEITGISDYELQLVGDDVLLTWQVVRSPNAQLHRPTPGFLDQDAAALRTDLIHTFRSMQAAYVEDAETSELAELRRREVGLEDGFSAPSRAAVRACMHDRQHEEDH